MNIFILDNNITKSAQYHVNKHIVKMVTETSQLISYVYHIRNEKINPVLHKLLERHRTHPCTIWNNTSLQNFIWLCNFGIELYNEYQYRYNQPDKHQRALQIFQYGLKNPPNLPDVGLTEFARAIKKDKYPDLLNKNKYPDVVECYREYYRRDKRSQFFRFDKKQNKIVHCWTRRNIPSFINEQTISLAKEELKERINNGRKEKFL